MSAARRPRSHLADRPRQPRTAEQRARVWDWALRIVLGVIAVIVLIEVVGPPVRYWFSGDRAVVDTLSSSSLYVGSGAAPVDPATIAGIIGTRPLAIVSLSSSDPLARDTLGTCEGVVGQLPDLIVKVIVDGTSDAGCEGKDVRWGAGVDGSGWDYVFWTTQSGADDLLVGDVPAITRQLALAYDAEVKGGRLIGAQRHFSAPANRWVLTAVLAVAVVAGAIAAFLLLRWGTRRYLVVRERRRSWEAERARVDGELGDIALIIVGVRPEDRSARTLNRAVGAVAEDYRQALDDLDRARPEDDLSGLADRVGRMRQRLESAAAHG
jgi:hypothetical protein